MIDYMRKLTASLSILTLLSLGLAVPSPTVQAAEYSSAISSRTNPPQPPRHARNERSFTIGERATLSRRPNPHSRNNHGKDKGNVRGRGNNSGGSQRPNAGNNGGGPSRAPQAPPRETTPPTPVILHCGPETISVTDARVVCIVSVQPTKTRVVTKTETKTRTEKVLQGAGILALCSVGAGLLALFLGYVLGWRGADKNEKKYLSSLLGKNK